MALRKQLFLITALLLIIYIVFPLFGDTLGIPVWFPSLASSFIMLVLYPGAIFSNKTFWWFLFYAFLLIVYLSVGKPLTIGIGSSADNKKIIIEFAYILPTVCIFSILVFLKEDDLIRRLINWSTVFLFLSFVLNVPLLIKYHSIRDALVLERNEELLIPGLPGYSLMHAYTLFLPVLCYCVKCLKGERRVLALIGLLIMCFVIYDTFVTTSLILMAIILIITLLYSENKSTFGIGFFAVFLLLLFLYKTGFFITLIDTLLPAFEDTAVETKLYDFKESILVGHLTGGSITGRQDYHAISLNSFFQKPIFGASIVGDHSTLMDRFGGMGLVVGIPFVMIFISYVQQMISLFKTEAAKFFFWIGIFTGFVYLYNKGNWGCEDWIFYMVLLPMGLLAFEGTSKIKQMDSFTV